MTGRSVLGIVYSGPSTTTKVTSTTAAPVVCPDYTVLPNRDISAGNMHFSQAFSNVTECQLICDAMSQCTGFVTNGQGCWYKNFTGDYTLSPGNTGSDIHVKKNLACPSTAGIIHKQDIRGRTFQS